MEKFKYQVMGRIFEAKRAVLAKVFHKESGIDGILVTIGLCIIALVLCVVMKDSLKTFVTTLVDDMTRKAQNILSGTV